MAFAFYGYIVRSFLPFRLRNVPIPKSLCDLIMLHPFDFMHILSFVSVCGTVFLLIKDGASDHQKPDYREIVGTERHQFCKDSNVVIYTKDLEYGVKFCRCLKSKRFPYCDGSHNAFNDGSRNDIHPLVISRRLDYPFFQDIENDCDDRECQEKEMCYNGCDTGCGDQSRQPFTTDFTTDFTDADELGEENTDF